MARNKKGKAKGKKAKVSKPGAVAWVPRPLESARQRQMQQYDALLRDPCGGPLVHPPYMGTDSGYLVRTTDILGLTGTGTGLTVGDSVSDWLIQYTPSWGNRYLLGVNIGGANNPMGALAATSVTNFVSGTVVERFRPVAACVKWVPTGAYSKRAGMVCLGYFNGQQYVVGDTPYPGPAMALCQHYAPNGGEHHEVRWLPTNNDQSFVVNNTSDSGTTGGGTTLIVLKGVDGVNTNTTTTVASGLVEITAVWEWVPASAQGASTAPISPPPFTINDHQATIKNIGEYLITGAAAAGAAAGRAAVLTGATLLTAGVRRAGTRGPALLM
uniref:Uncharacterized protein n=1 Tax=Trichosanthes kirilowii tombusvirus TaxID=2768088 RepID=A0A7G9INN2_9TOMB|nr:hypothetical protein [Trichosanthes kirilowii tombusvirus]